MEYPCNCNDPLTGKSGKLNSNPDVAGLGVLVGLTCPALVTFVLLLVYYLSAVEPDNLNMWTTLDVSFLKWLHMKRPGWRTNGKALEKIILSFSDAQLVNAFSLLLGAFTMGCSLDPYHWQIMVQCAWFTSATHLATIPILRAQLYAAGPGVSRIPIYIRAALMTLVLAMLVSSLVPTGHPLWLWGSFAHPTEGVTLPALCFYDEEEGPDAARMTAFGWIWLSWSIGLATVTFVKRLFELITSPTENQDTSFRDKLRAWNKSMDEDMENYVIMKFFWKSSQVTVWTVWRLLESFAGHIFWLSIMLSWNIYLLAYNKWYFQLAVEDEDNKWGFGQTTPLILLILPAITIVEEYFAKQDCPEDERPSVGRPSSQIATDKTYDESTRITVFIMFEFLVIFALLGSINFVSIITAAGSDSGARFLAPFLASLLAAPLVFTLFIHVFDKIFEAMNFRNNTWRNAVIAVIVALSIGAAISFFFVHEYLDLFRDSITYGLAPFEL